MLINCNINLNIYSFHLTNPRNIKLDLSLLQCEINPPSVHHIFISESLTLVECCRQCAEMCVRAAWDIESRQVASGRHLSHLYL